MTLIPDTAIIEVDVFETSDPDLQAAVMSTIMLADTGDAAAGTARA